MDVRKRYSIKPWMLFQKQWTLNSLPLELIQNHSEQQSLPFQFAPTWQDHTSCSIPQMSFVSNFQAMERLPTEVNLSAQEESSSVSETSGKPNRVLSSLQSWEWTDFQKRMSFLNSWFFLFFVNDQRDIDRNAVINKASKFNHAVHEPFVCQCRVKLCM